MNNDESEAGDGQTNASGGQTNASGGQPVEAGASIGSLDVGILDVLDSLPFYVMLIDRHHRILLVNKASRTALGLKPEDIVGAYCPMIVHGLKEGEEYPGCPLEETVRKNEPIEWEHFDERISRWLRTGVYPTRSRMPDGERIYFHMVADITDEKLAQDKIERSEEKYRLLLEELIKPL